MTFRFGFARSWIRELAWLLGSWAFSWALLSQLFGYNYLRHPQLDIQLHSTYFQLHSTYFVLQPLLLTALVLLPAATLVTGGRVLASAFRRSGPNAVLGLLVSIWAVLGLLVAGVLLRR